MQAYYKDSYEDVSDWTKNVDAIFQHYDDLYDLGYKYLSAYNDVDRIAKRSQLDNTIVSTMTNVQVIKFDLHSTLGQVVAGYFKLRDMPLPTSAIQKGHYLLFAPETGDWFAELVGQVDTTFTEYAKTLGIEIVWGEDNAEAV